MINLQHYEQPSGVNIYTVCRCVISLTDFIQNALFFSLHHNINCWKLTANLIHAKAVLIFILKGPVNTIQIILVRRHMGKQNCETVTYSGRTALSVLMLFRVFVELLVKMSKNTFRLESIYQQLLGNHKEHKNRKYCTLLQLLLSCDITSNLTTANGDRK